MLWRERKREKERNKEVGGEAHLLLQESFSIFIDLAQFKKK